MLNDSTSPNGKRSMDIQSSSGGRLINIYRADSVLRATLDRPPPGRELTLAYHGLCRDTDRVGNRRAEKP